LSSIIRITGQGNFSTGREYLLGPESLQENGLGYSAGYETIMEIRAGSCLRTEENLFQVTDKIWMTVDKGQGGIFLNLRALNDFFMEQSLDLSLTRQGFSLAWITLSDKGSKGHRLDQSGPLIQEIAGSFLELSLVRGFIIPDDYGILKSLLVHLALLAGFDLIITTGGTGLGPRDITPEAALDVIDKRLPGFEQAMISYSLTKTPHAMISRAVAGTLGQSLLINLPGSPKGVRENLEVALPAMEHALKKLQGDQSDCATKV
jgi:molybdopterin adenylyltransferase